MTKSLEKKDDKARPEWRQLSQLVKVHGAGYKR
jgi:hypothetical protein